MHVQRATFVSVLLFRSMPRHGCSFSAFERFKASFLRNEFDTCNILLSQLKEIHYSGSTRLH
ncbi:hypothetical protein BVRB_5g106330 [Beta vulgaris subsp. vulgaris]|nr:hypothetical protein BVRB_5g106330 [Beta vulgaris subsp. vulgaris]